MLNAHMDYLTRVDEFFRGHIDDPKATDCHSCLLGKWLEVNAAASPLLKQHPAYSRIVDLHEKFHATTADAIAKKANGGEELLAEAYSLFGQTSATLLELDDVLRKA